MLKIQMDNQITLTRGDTAYLAVDIVSDTSGEAYAMGAKDVLKLTVKRAIEDTAPVLTKVVTGRAAFALEPGDTKALAFGQYHYDIELTTADGEVYTVIPDSVFVVANEVG